MLVEFVWYTFHKLKYKIKSLNFYRFNRIHGKTSWNRITNVTVRKKHNILQFVVLFFI